MIYIQYEVPSPYLILLTDSLSITDTVSEYLVWLYVAEIPFEWTTYVAECVGMINTLSRHDGLLFLI